MQKLRYLLTFLEIALTLLNLVVSQEDAENEVLLFRVVLKVCLVDMADHLHAGGLSEKDVDLCISYGVDHMGDLSLQELAPYQGEFIFVPRMEDKRAYPLFIFVDMMAENCGGVCERHCGKPSFLQVFTS